MKDFIVIAISPPAYYPDESERINALFESKQIDFLHIRKPDWTRPQIELLISRIKKEFYPYIKLHDHFELLDKIPLGGIHLNSRNMNPHPKAKSVSKSIHSLQEISDMDELDYFFISPVFDSISKAGYKAAFEFKILAEKISGKKAVALGGVTPDKLPLLKKTGFAGAAMLGHFFP